MDTLHNEMQEIFRNVFGDDQFILMVEMTAIDIEGWDSLAHINLIIAIEKQYGIKFATAEISRLKDDGQNVGSLIDLVRRKRKTVGP